MNDSYRFAELPEEALKDLQQLEHKLSSKSGEDVTLIAYINDKRPDAPACRAGLEGD